MSPATLLKTGSDGSPATSSLTLDSGSMTSNTITTGPYPTNGGSEPPGSSSTAANSSDSGSLGFDAAITASSISAAAATLSSTSPSTSTSVQASDANRFDLCAVPIFAILITTVAIVS